MKPSLEPWEVGLADQVKRHEFDYQPEAYAQFEQLLAAEAVGAAAVSTSAAAWWTSTTVKLTLLGLALLAGVTLYLFSPEGIASPAQVVSASQAIETQAESLDPIATPTQLPMSEPTTTVKTISTIAQNDEGRPRQFTPNPAPARRRPTAPVKLPLAELPAADLPAAKAPIDFEAVTVIRRVSALQLLPRPALPELITQAKIDRRPIKTSNLAVRSFKRDRSTLFPDVKPRR